MGRCAVSTQKQKRPFALRALAAFAGTLAILFGLLLPAYALPGVHCLFCLRHCHLVCAGIRIARSTHGFSLHIVVCFPGTSSGVI